METVLGDLTVDVVGGIWRANNAMRKNRFDTVHVFFFVRFSR